MPEPTRLDAPVECLGLLRVYDTPTGRVQAVKGVDLTIDHGVCAAVVGPSGSGKSSLLRLIVGIDEPSAGDVVIAGISLARLPAKRRRRTLAGIVSHVHQRPQDNLLPDLTVRQQLERVARRRHADDASIDALLDRLGLTAIAHRLPDQLSGGEQQRAAFARGAIGDPAVIVADEPTAELDRESTRHVLDTIDALTARGLTVVVATHDPQVLERVDQVIHLDDGAVTSVRDGTDELSVIDRAGRLQLPASMRHRFPDRRARLGWDDAAGALKVTPP